MAFIREMLSEGGENGGVSNIRVMSFICLCYTLFIHAYSLIKNKDLSFEVLLALLLAAFAPKVLQKFAETKA